MQKKPAQSAPATIKPADVSLSAVAKANQTPATLPWWQQHRLQMVALAVLTVVSMAVIFLLPKAVEPPQAPPEITTAVPPPAKPIESPWEEAQLAKQRKEAQAILAELLKQQSSLEDMAVERWAQEPFSQAMETATAGDKEYRQRKFAQADILYRESLTQFETLVEQSNSVFSQAIENGQDAIEKGVVSKALAEFELAVAIRADDATAQQGLQRAQVLKQVLDLIKAGLVLEKTQALEQAQQQYEQALALDPLSKRATEKLTAVKQAIVARDFAKAMSQGYAALNSHTYGQAKTFFRQALKIIPDAAEARQALEQASNQQTQSRIQRLLAAAGQEENQEHWQKASEQYQTILTLDSSVVSARVGLIRSSARADLDTKLEQILAAPSRLANQAVYKQTRQLLTDAEAIAQPGQRLSNQIDRLHTALKVAVTPVAIRLQSDNQTEVTLYKIGKLGNFTNREMSLKPGIYTAVGSRDGYKDVRQEFSVRPGEKIKTIVIQCVEKISLDG